MITPVCCPFDSFRSSLLSSLPMRVSLHSATHYCVNCSLYCFLQYAQNLLNVFFCPFTISTPPHVSPFPVTLSSFCQACSWHRTARRRAAISSSEWREFALEQRLTGAARRRFGTVDWRDTARRGVTLIESDLVCLRIVSGFRSTPKNCGSF